MFRGFIALVDVINPSGQRCGIFRVRSDRSCRWRSARPGWFSGPLARQDVNTSEGIRRPGVVPFMVRKRRDRWGRWGVARPAS